MEQRPTIVELAAKYGTDKEGAHHYGRHYDRHLAHLRDTPIRVLEIGIGGYDDPKAGGESLRMWKAYFPKAEIFGLDIVDKASLAEDRITPIRGDQGDASFLKWLGAEYGPFDVVVDDGSHRSVHVIVAFHSLWPFLTDKGIYVIEDLQTSYWPSFGGGRPGARGTAMAMLKDLANGLNHAEWRRSGHRPIHLELEVEGISLYHNLAFIQKGSNDEPAMASPSRRFLSSAMEPKQVVKDRAMRGDVI